ARPATAGEPAVGRVTHVVQPGETYWSIAADLPHEGDLRVFIDRLVDANGSRPLVVGDHIEVPTPAP
ncbi:MAG TPA: LysM domain-containing protein, partial [Acidimicrobiales bacterium]|nr:LysM domain-containing protein [Acidimicrobiales bacterium]